MEEIVKLVTHYRKKAIGYRSAANNADENGGLEQAQNLRVRAACWEDVAEDLDAWLAVQEIPEGVE